MTSPAATTFSHVDSLIARRVLARTIDDGIVIALAFGLAKAVATVLDASSHTGGVLQLMNVFEVDSSGPASTLPVLLTVSLLLLGAGAFYVGASATDGRTPGRALAGLEVLRADGRPASFSLLLGRELLRISLLAFAIALVWPFAGVITSVLAGLPADGEVLDLLIATVSWLPFPIVAAAWIGATLVDPLGRAPHDRIARTLVTSATGSRRPGAEQPAPE